MLVEISDRPAVRNKITVKAPFIQLGHKEITGAGRFAVNTVVCAHYSFDSGFLYKAFKGWKISLLHILG